MINQTYDSKTKNSELYSISTPKFSFKVDEKQSQAEAAYFFEEGYKMLDLEEYQNAVQMFVKGANLGHLLSQKYYGQLRIAGKGIEKNEEEGLQILLNIALQGDYDSQCTFNEIDPKILEYDNFNDAWYYLKNQLGFFSKKY